MATLPRRLSLWITLGALGVYTITLSQEVTLNSLALTAQVAGWDGKPMVGHPLLWLLTRPLQLLPAAGVPWGLNLFFAAGAGLTLGLLARTVRLLPWDRPWEKTNQLAEALPVLLACVLCGLEFNFWQEATAAAGEMLDLLLLASVLWLLLEYRVRRNSRWLKTAILVWGLGMAENWVMLLALPLFVAGVIWLKGSRFFRLKFLLRLSGWLLAGLSIYALTPMVNGLAPHSPWSLGEAWMVSLKQTKGLIGVLYHQSWGGHRLLTLAVGLYFLVPTLSLLVRLRDEGTRNKSRMDRFQIRIYRGLRVVLLLTCLWLAFDPTTGPRQIIQHQFGFSLPLLTFDYLNALGAAFLAGNFLLMAQRMVRRRRNAQTRIDWRRLAVPFAAACLILLSAGLAGRNAPAIVRMNFHPLQRFGEFAAAALPAGGGVMLSDQPQKLAVFQAALSHHRDGADWLAVDTHALPTVEYRARLDRRRPLGWLTDETRHELSPVETVRLLEHIARTNRLCYLHPSYGHFFERFYLEPAGAIYEMKLREKNSLENPPLAESATEANETFWTGAWKKDLVALAPAPSRRQTGWQKKIQRLGFAPPPRHQDHLLAEWYSLALDGWGVALQQQGRWNEARLRLEQARQLNTNNLSARISLACNTNFQSGRKLGLAGLDKVAAQLGNARRLTLIMNNWGPFDEPVFCYLLGCTFQQTGLWLQAAQQFERTRTLAPGVLAPEFVLAEIYTRLRFTDRARPLISHLQAESENLPPNNALDLDLALLEANSWLSQTNPANARSVLQSVLLQHPDDARIANRVLSAYLAFGDFTNALRLVETQLARSPDDVSSLNSQAAILIQAGQAAAAIPVLDHVLALTNLPVARLNRALAWLISQDFAAAESDFRKLEKSGEEPGRVSYGLAMIAGQRHDTNQAAHYFQLCLSNSPPESPIWQQATYQLQTLAPAEK